MGARQLLRLLATILHLSGRVWVVAYVALLRGHWRAARVLATLGLVQG